MEITTSNDITKLEVKATFDLSGTTPVLSLVNMSAGPNLAAMSWWVELYSPSNSIIHKGSASSLDMTGAWANKTISDSWPRPYQQIEWSGAPYIATIYAKDSSGQTWSISKSASICRPSGNTNLSKNYYGLANVYVKTICEQARIYFEDRTTTSYKGIEGTRVAGNLKVFYPIDETYTVPAPFEISNFSNAAAPITYSSDNYQFVAYSVYDYDIGDNVHVKIKYQQIATFAVLCNVDLCPLASHIIRLVDDIENGDAVDVTLATQKLGKITSKFMLVVMGKMEPLCGVDVPKLIDEIISIGGFPENCCAAPTGVIPLNASIIDGYTFQVVPSGGDVTGSVTKEGSVIKFNLSDKSYVFKVGDSPSSGAFTITESVSVDGFTKTFFLNSNIAQFATDLVSVINSNPTILNTWNTIFAGATTGLKISVDGGCIFTSTSSSNYTFTVKNIPLTTTYAILTGIKINDVFLPLNYSFNQANPSGLQTYLNTLGMGTWSVVKPSPNANNSLVITSNTNIYDLKDLSYKISGTSYLADFNKTSSGYIEISANEAVQKIIDYICALDDTMIITSEDYTICSFDAAGAKTTTVITKGSTLSALIVKLIDLKCTELNYSGTAGGGVLSCDSLKTLFQVSAVAIGATDYLFGVKGGVCARMSLPDIFAFMLDTTLTNGTLLQKFCDVVAQCGAGNICEPYELFDVAVTTYSSSCTPIVGIEYTLA